MIRHILIPILLLIGALIGKAEAQTTPQVFPYTMPAQMGGSGSPLKVGWTPDGRWAAYTYIGRDDKVHRYTVCMLYTHTLMEPDTIEQFKTPIALARAFLAKNINTNCSIDPRMRSMFQAAEAAFPLPVGWKP